jgi:enoyl-CoA hydratase/carnithine racemase
MRFTIRVLPSRASNLGIIELNNPKALNSLSMDMIECLQDVFEEWMKDSTMKAILFKAAEAKRPSFCAGGDVKAVWEMGIRQDADSAITSQFFYQEYRVNHAIATYQKPIVSLWDGVVMGGGVGLSIHGKYRVATENSLFAMPETAIGLFPDVGSMYWMPRLLPMPAAKYLALTGQRITAPDLLYTGLATHYVPSNRLRDLEKALVEATKTPDSEQQQQNDQDEDVVADVLNRFHESIPTSECLLVKNQKSIETLFDGSTCEEIFEALEQRQQHNGVESDDQFVAQTLKSLQKVSPTSLKVTLEGLKRGAAVSSIGEDLQMEYRMARASILKGADFFEGVRSVLVDKDRAPQWNPMTIQEVSDDRVAEYFAPIAEEWEIPNNINNDNMSSEAASKL